MEVIPGITLFNKLRERYNNLSRKERFETLSFEERFYEAEDLMQSLLRQEFYPYRRVMDSFTPDLSGKGLPKDWMRVNLASNDYLGFTHHPLIIKTGMEYMEKFGSGSGSVPMLAGTFSIHSRLEERLANFTGYNAALIFNSGYSANFGLLTSVLTMHDIAILDTHVHASIIDGCCKTNVIYFSHNDIHSLQTALKKAESFRNKLVIVDGIYSMDGDCAPLQSIIETAKENNAMVMVDESHALGVMGEQGRGTQQYFHLSEKADIITSSLGKALGSIGGFIAGSEGLKHLLEFTCRSFMFSASIPPAVAASLEEAIELLESDDDVLERLRKNINVFKSGLQQAGFHTGNSVSAILPVVINDGEKLVLLTRQLFEKGIAVNPVFYPVVPRKRNRIRISVTAELSTQQMEYALEQLEAEAKILGII